MSFGEIYPNCSAAVNNLLQKLVASGDRDSVICATSKLVTCDTGTVEGW